MSALGIYVRTALDTSKVFVSLSVSTMDLLHLQPLPYYLFFQELASFRAASKIIARCFKWKFQWLHLDFHKPRVMFFDEEENCVDVFQPYTSQNSGMCRYKVPHYVVHGAVYILQEDDEVLRRFQVRTQTWESFTAPGDLGICWLFGCPNGRGHFLCGWVGIFLQERWCNNKNV